jgi:hypothetical protein
MTHLYKTIQHELNIKIISLLLFPLCAQAHWIDDQVAEDLSRLSSPRFSSSQLYSYFQTLSAQGVALLYGTIRDNVVSWIPSAQKDPPRNTALFAYFEMFASRWKLPDTDFIIAVGDGLATPPDFPLFTFSRTHALPNALLMPDVEMCREIAFPEINWISRCSTYSSRNRWEDKMPIAFFRGADTGFCEPHLPDFGNVRFRTCLFSLAHPDLVDARLCVALWPLIADAYATQLALPYERVPEKGHFRYKYLLDIDGHFSAYARSRWILLSNSVPLKIDSPYEQWYHRTLQPFVHFVPVKADLSDLAAQILALRADDRRARQIAEAGRFLGAEIFSPGYVNKYFHTLLWAYSKRIKLDRPFSSPILQRRYALSRQKSTVSTADPAAETPEYSESSGSASRPPQGQNWAPTREPMPCAW